MVFDILLFSVVKIIERFIKKYKSCKSHETVLNISQAILFIGVACAVIHSYVSAVELIVFGVRTQWNALVAIRG